jgi:hypothetical protein
LKPKRFTRQSTQGSTATAFTTDDAIIDFEVSGNDLISREVDENFEGKFVYTRDRVF